MRPIFPGWFVTGILGAMGIALVLAFSLRSSPETSISTGGHGVPVAERQLRFVDYTDGDVGVLDAQDGESVLRLSTGEGGFMRSVMRGMARERRVTGQGSEAPFTLTLWSDGLVSITDPVTGRDVALSAFGVDNVKAFSSLL